MARVGGRWVTAGRVGLVRLMTPIGKRYEEAFAQSHPFDKLVEGMLSPGLVQDTVELMMVRPEGTGPLPDHQQPGRRKRAADGQGNISPDFWDKSPPRPLPSRPSLSSHQPVDRTFHHGIINQWEAELL